MTVFSYLHAPAYLDLNGILMVNDVCINNKVHSFDCDDLLRCFVEDGLREWLKSSILHKHLKGSRLSAEQDNNFYIVDSTKNIEFTANSITLGSVVAVMYKGGLYDTSKILERLTGAVSGVEGHRHFRDEAQGNISLVD